MSRKDEPFDIVNRARHYNGHPSGIEVAEITDLMNFNIGNTFKYVARRYGKEYTRSLESAVWYLKRFHTDPRQDACQDSWTYMVVGLIEEYAAHETAPTAKKFYLSLARYISEGYDLNCFLDLMNLLDILKTEAPRIVQASIGSIDFDKLQNVGDVLQHKEGEQ